MQGRRFSGKQIDGSRVEDRHDITKAHVSGFAFVSSNY